MKLTKAQTEQIKQIIRWYGIEHGSQIIRDLSMSGYFATGSLKNITSSGTDIARTIMNGPVPVPHNPVGFIP